MKFLSLPNIPMNFEGMPVTRRDKKLKSVIERTLYKMMANTAIIPQVGTLNTGGNVQVDTLLSAVKIVFV
ncbi:MAG: hypothetical protein ACU4EQ_07265 [Candidatus Nitrosoglobus sp.]|jgi:hypothetical protein